MSPRTIPAGLALAALGILAACAADSPPPASAPQPVVPGSEATIGVTEEQAVTDDEVVAQLASAKCDRSQSCNSVGPGATYHDRGDCIQQMSLALRTEINASRCEGGIGSRALATCVKGIHLAECTEPGQVVGGTAHCQLNAMCLK